MRRLLLLPLMLLGLPAPGRAAGDGEKGKPIFVAQGSSWHGKTGDGNGPLGEVLNPRPRADVPPAEEMAGVLQEAGKANGLSKDMDAYPALSDPQVADVIAYIKTLAK
jgi:mono/diheme cytochrome c family protein